MGCGASKATSTADAPAEPPRGGKKASDSGNNIAPKGQTTTHSGADTDAPKKKPSKLDEADGIGANFDAAAAVTVAAGTATLVAGTVSSDARGALSSAASTAGLGLLAFAKELPWVAPIAFLIAGVVTASAEVHTLKADAQVFCKNVQSCEAILNQVAAKGYLGHVRESVEALQQTLEDGLAFCQRLKLQWFITQLIMSGRDTVKFREISNSMHRQVSVIAAAASIDVQAQIRDDFAQGEKLREKIESLGGFGEVASDPTKMTVAREFLKASDELLLSSVENVRDAVKAEAEKNRAAMEAMERRASERMDALRAQSEAQAKVLQDQVAQLTSMMAAVLGQRTGAAAETAGVTLDFGREDGGLGGSGPTASSPPEPESSPPEPESSPPEPHPEAPEQERETPDPAPEPRPRVATRDEADAVADSVYSGANVRDIMSKMDLYEDEAERRRVVSDSALEYEEIGDLVDNDDLHLLTDACAKELGVTDSFIGIIDSKRQTYVSHSKFDVNTGEARAHGDGLYCANVGTVCKHVVKRGDAMQTNVRPTRRWRVCRTSPTRSTKRSAPSTTPRARSWATRLRSSPSTSTRTLINPTTPRSKRSTTGGAKRTRTARKRSQPWVACARWPIPSSVTITFTTPEYRSNCKVRRWPPSAQSIENGRGTTWTSRRLDYTRRGRRRCWRSAPRRKSWRGWECRRSQRRWRPSRDTFVFFMRGK